MSLSIIVNKYSKDNDLASYCTMPKPETDIKIIDGKLIIFGEFIVNFRSMYSIMSPGQYLNFPINFITPLFT